MENKKVFEEPKMEFVEINPEDNVTASGNGSYETCNGPDAPSNNCSTYNVFFAG